MHGPKLHRKQKPGDFAVESSYIDANAELHFEQRHDIGTGLDAQTETLAQFHGILLSLSPHVSPQDRAFGRIVRDAFNAQQIFQFDFGLREIGQQFCGCAIGG